MEELVACEDLLKPAPIFELQRMFIFCIIRMLGRVGDNVSIARNKPSGPSKGIDGIEVKIRLHDTHLLYHEGVRYPLDSC